MAHSPSNPDQTCEGEARASALAGMGEWLPLPSSHPGWRPEGAFLWVLAPFSSL